MASMQTEIRIDLLRTEFKRIFVDIFQENDSPHSRKNKNQKVYDLFAKETPENLKNTLAEAAEIIFESFQLQIFIVTYGRNYENDLTALVKIAKLRSFDYIHNNSEKFQITPSLIVQSVLDSQRNLQTQNEPLTFDEDIEIKCPLIFEKTGLLKRIADENVTQYYSKCNGTNSTTVYGYRTTAVSEEEDKAALGEYQLVFEINDKTVRPRKYLQVNVQEPSQHFTGRTKELYDLHSMFGSDWQDVRPKYVWLSGLRGVGKSELAKKYIHSYKDEYDRNILWIDCSSTEKIRKSFEEVFTVIYQGNGNEEILEKTDIKTIAINSYKLLLKSKTLIVFDNVQHANHLLNIAPPQAFDYSRHFSVIITSRKKPKVSSSNRGIKFITLNALNFEEAIELSRKLFSFNDPEFLSGTSIELFAASMDCFPLAITMAVKAFMHLKRSLIFHRKNHSEMDQFLDMLDVEKRVVTKQASFLVKYQNMLEDILNKVDVEVNANKMMDILIYLKHCNTDSVEYSLPENYLQELYVNSLNAPINQILVTLFKTMLSLENKV